MINIFLKVILKYIWRINKNIIKYYLKIKNTKSKNLFNSVCVNI
jgi:hypothetical protein